VVMTIIDRSPTALPRPSVILHVRRKGTSCIRHNDHATDRRTECGELPVHRNINQVLVFNEGGSDPLEYGKSVYIRTVRNIIL